MRRRARIIERRPLLIYAGHTINYPLAAGESRCRVRSAHLSTVGRNSEAYCAEQEMRFFMMCAVHTIKK
jgi:hypothetical protein